MLGKLKEVDPRIAWKNESIDFTPWLSREENMEELGKELNLDIIIRKTEAPVGDFSVDILAEESDTGDLIIIENQLDATDHNHLGKLITYAANYEAKYLIWIVREVRDEHRKAIDWLNENMEEEINLFLVKIQLWQIGDSNIAPKFSVISSPNEWAKTVRQLGEASLTATKLKQLDFWNKFKEYAEKNGTKLRLRKTGAQHWYDISYGSSESHIGLTINTQQKLLGCEIYIHESKDLFKLFITNKEKIEEELGEKLEWMELPDKKASRIKIAKKFDLNDISQWNEGFQWLKTEAEKFQKIFSKYKSG